ncbi:dihydrodipicolinate synthase family protein, partial [Streptomyces sp. NPDC088270]
MQTNPLPRTRPWHGVMVATPVTLREDRTIDYDAYATHVRRLIEAGCDGVVPNGSLGEYQTLTDDERDQVVRVAV